MFPAIASTLARRAAAVPAAAAFLLLATACSQTRSDMCVQSVDGRPAVASTQSEELCEVARLRVHEALGRFPGLDELRAEQLHDMSFRWGDARTLDGMLGQIRKDTNDDFADRVAKAVADVRTHSKKPAGAGCGDAAAAERCLVRGAARGAQLAIDDAIDLLRRTRKPDFRPTESSGT